MARCRARLRRAVELNRNNALAHLQLGLSVLVMHGRFHEGLRAVRQASQLDPLSPYTSTEFARALLLAGTYRESIEQARKAIEGSLVPFTPAWARRNRPSSIWSSSSRCGNRGLQTFCKLPN